MSGIKIRFRKPKQTKKHITKTSKRAWNVVIIIIIIIITSISIIIIIITTATTITTAIINIIIVIIIIIIIMRPLLYLELDAAPKKIGWVRPGENIKYSKMASGIKQKYIFSKLL